MILRLVKKKERSDDIIMTSETQRERERWKEKGNLSPLNLIVDLNVEYVRVDRLPLDKFKNCRFNFNWTINRQMNVSNVYVLLFCESAHPFNLYFILYSCSETEEKMNLFRSAVFSHQFTTAENFSRYGSHQKNCLEIFFLKKKMTMMTKVFNLE